VPYVCNSVRTWFKKGARGHDAAQDQRR
jgi:hypothetical protein